MSLKLSAARSIFDRSRFGYALQNEWDWSQIAVAWGMAYFGAAPLSSIALVYMLDAYNGLYHNPVRETLLMSFRCHW